jgi:ligand-binding SRPBCC domain-containing protein
VHEHTFTARDGGTLVGDHVRYRVPGGRIVHELVVRRDVERIFDFRRERLAALLGTAHEQEPGLATASSTGGGRAPVL